MQRRYDRIIIIQRQSTTQSGSGEEITAWTDLAYRCFAHVAPTRGAERVAGPQPVALQETTFRIRWHTIAPSARPLGPEDRIIYPAQGLSINRQDPSPHKIYNIIVVNEIEREHDLQILTIRRSDVVADDSEPVTGFSLDFAQSQNSGYVPLFEDV